MNFRTRLTLSPLEDRANPDGTPVVPVVPPYTPPEGGPVDPAPADPAPAPAPGEGNPVVPVVPPYTPPL